MSGPRIKETRLHTPPHTAPSADSAGGAHRIYHGGSALRYPRSFLRQAISDLLGSWQAALRLFGQSIAQKYRYSALGIFWAFAPAALTAVLLTVGKRADLTILRDGIVAPQVYAIFGLILGQTFLEAMATQRTLFLTHRYLLSRHQAPVEGLIIAGILENLFGLAMKVGLLALVFLQWKTIPSVTVPLGIFGMTVILLLGTTLGLLLAPWSALKRDLDNVMGVFPWAFMGLTPIFVPPQPDSPMAEIYRWNPFAYVFDATRFLTYGYGHQPMPGVSGSGMMTILLGALAVCIVLLPAAWILCRVARPYIVESYLV
ncbi:MAG: ABC transporter permease [Capsulimonadales bacterium]|nr:ABC transporter permease [Capsulimonadales bacterium]